MIAGPELLLIGAVAAVGVLHTIVPDRWVPYVVERQEIGQHVTTRPGQPQMGRSFHLAQIQQLFS